MIGANLLVATLGLALAGAAMTPAKAHSLNQIEEQIFERESYLELTDKEAPRFALEDAEGRNVNLDDFRGKVVVLDFIFARCKEACPLQSELIAFVQERINGTPMRDMVQFVSIATDTEDARETAEIMRSYHAKHGLDPVNWVFLYRGSGAADATVRLAERYGLKFMYTSDGDQMHGVVTHIIDKDGVLRARYHGLKFNPTNLVLHVNALTNDHHRGGRPGDSGAATQGPDPNGPMSDSWWAIVIALLGLGLAAGVVPLYRMLRKRAG